MARFFNALGIIILIGVVLFVPAVRNAVTGATSPVETTTTTIYRYQTPSPPPPTPTRTCRQPLGQPMTCGPYDTFNSDGSFSYMYTP